MVFPKSMVFVLVSSRRPQAFLLNESNAPQQTDAAAHMVRSDLNKNLRS